jgi:hypothetical protein
LTDQTQIARKWLTRFFTGYYRQHPVNATFIGVHEYDHLLPDCDPQALDDARDLGDTLLREAFGIDLSVLPEHLRHDIQLAMGQLEIQSWELTSTHFQRGNPAYYTGEAIFGVMSLFQREFAPLEERMENAIRRMEAIPVFLEQARINVPRQHPEWTQRAIRECDGAIAFFRRGINAFDGGPALDRPAHNAAEAFEFHRMWLEEHVLVSPDAHVGCGEEALELLLRRGHVLDMNSDEILEYAVTQADEAEARLVDGASEFGGGHWQDILARLQDEHPTVDRYYERYQELWDGCRSIALEQRLLTWPDYPIRYVPRPAWAREAAPLLYFLFYRSPAPFDSVPVVEYLVTPIEPEMSQDEQQALLRANNDSVIKLNHVVHHGSIGHHVQNWHAFRSRSRIGQVAAVDCASRIAMFCGGTMAEGWSSYTTELMAETDFLTPLERYSLHYGRLRAATRAVVDMRLHSGAITLGEARHFYEQRAGMSASAAREEAVKNSMFPGAAMIYLIGIDMIHDLRRDISTAQGPAFDLAAFHDELLSYGSIPVSMIANSMRSTHIHAE